MLITSWLHQTSLNRPCNPITRQPEVYLGLHRTQIVKPVGLCPGQSRLIRGYAVTLPAASFFALKLGKYETTPRSVNNGFVGESRGGLLGAVRVIAPPPKIQT